MKSDVYSCSDVGRRHVTGCRDPHKCSVILMCTFLIYLNPTGIILHCALGDPTMGHRTLPPPSESTRTPAGSYRRRSQATGPERGRDVHASQSRACTSETSAEMAIDNKCRIYDLNEQQDESVSICDKGAVGTYP